MISESEALAVCWLRRGQLVTCNLWRIQRKESIVKTITKFCLAVFFTVVSTMASAQQYNKLWWDPNQNGMGTPITHQISVLPDGTKQDVIFGVWFHYTPVGDATWLTFTCNPLVKDSLGRDSCTGPLARVRGSQPMGYDPSKFAV